MKTKSRPFKPKSKWLRADAAQRTRDFNKWHQVDGPGQPGYKIDKPHGNIAFYAPRWKELENEKAAKRQRDLILYASAIGQKHGLLPCNLSHYRVDHALYVGTDGDCEIVFTKVDGQTVSVTLHNLYWVPAEPVEEAVLSPPPY